MEDQNNKVRQYLIPANVSARFEFFDGFGWYEFKIVLIACLIGASFFFGLGLLKKTIYVDMNGIPVNMTEENENGLSMNEKEIIERKISLISPAIRLFAIIIPGTGAFFLVKREPSTGRSGIDTLICLKEFKKKQNTYLYKYNSGSEV